MASCFTVDEAAGGTVKIRLRVDLRPPDTYSENIISSIVKLALT